MLPALRAGSGGGGEETVVGDEEAFEPLQTLFLPHMEDGDYGAGWDAITLDLRPFLPPALVRIWVVGSIEADANDLLVVTVA